MILNDQSSMPYGLHAGTKMANVPAQYLLWLYENRKFNREVRIYIEDNIDVLNEQAGRKKNPVKIISSEKIT